jgi:hypothetical protein
MTTHRKEAELSYGAPDELEAQERWLAKQEAARAYQAEYERLLRMDYPAYEATIRAIANVRDRS